MGPPPIARKSQLRLVAIECSGQPFFFPHSSCSKQCVFAVFVHHSRAFSPVTRHRRPLPVRRPCFVFSILSYFSLGAPFAPLPLCSPATSRSQCNPAIIGCSAMRKVKLLLNIVPTQCAPPLSMALGATRRRPIVTLRLPSQKAQANTENAKESRASGLRNTSSRQAGASQAMANCASHRRTASSI